MLSKFTALSCLILAVAGCTPSAKEDPVSEKAPVARPSAAAPQTASLAALTRVADPSTVCMVNDQHMGIPQIPVQVNGKTYYGCCQMCEARLGQDPAIRSAVDPATRQPVDKATALIAKDASGKVLYFGSEESFAAYLAQR